MSSAQMRSNDLAAELAVSLLHEIFKREVLQNVGVRLWDSTQWPDDDPRPTTLVLKHPGALRSMLLPGTEVGLGEAYLYDDFDVEGKLESVFGLADDLAQDVNGVLQRLRTARSLLQLPDRPGRKKIKRGPARLKGRLHSIERDRQAVTYHYDVSNALYALWLDRRMVYSCAHFQTTNDDLDAAQEHKLDYICRKLCLRPGQRLLDIGCGWGGLVIYAAQHYGVEATGITLSQPQADLANARIAEAGLSDHCRVWVRDYREVDEPGGYDALVSVGMFEHVGA
jgi:cyclopropane-fatty-acyl-phospholipid synthase